MREQTGSDFFTPSIRFISKSEYVYRSIRSAILNGVIKPGSFLNQAELAEQLQVSRMPIRDAINMLTREGLVRIILHKGAKVTHFSPQDIQEIYAIRKILEGYAIREATLHIKEDHNISKHAHKKNIDAMIKENEHFHLLLYEPCQNQRLVELIQNLWSSYPKRIFWEIRGRAEQVVNQHKEVLAAVRARNPEKAEKLIQANLVLSPKALERMASAFGG
jgi:DNA-binding GntR family transcriptional regulator